MQKSFLIICLLLISQLIFAQQWEQKTNPPTSFDARHHPVTFAIDGYGYVATGQNQADQPLRDFYRYDAANDSWEELPDFPGTQRGFSYGVAADNGKAYMGFGLNNNTRLKDFWEYDPATEEWTELASCPCVARYHPAMVQAAGKIYVGLGSGSAGDLDDWWAYDIASDSWSQKPDFPAPGRHHPFYFDIDGKVYVGFGHRGSLIFKDFYMFNPNTNGWTQKANLPAEGRVAGTQFSYNGKGYLLSGDGDDHGPMPTGEMWEYDPTDDSWTSRTPHPGSSRWAPGSFVVDGTVYFVFGWINGENYEDIWGYDLSPDVSNNNIIETDIKLFPNPVSNRLIVETNETFDTYRIIDTSGKLVAEGIWDSNEINVSELMNGVYSIQFFLGEKSKTKKFSVLK